MRLIVYCALVILGSIVAGCGDAEYLPCAGKDSGEECTVCDPDDPDCIETAVIKTCDEQGQCGAHAATGGAGQGGGD